MKEICTALYQKTGGFIQGVCHPRGNHTLLKKAGLNWVRVDVPYPFDEQGNITSRYQEFKKERQTDAQNGLSAILVTPYPKHFINHGIDVKTPEGLYEATRICAFLARDFADLPVCWQATNEMHIVHFRAPLNAQQAKDFIIACIHGLAQGNPAAAIGHNSVNHDWASLCAQIEEKAPCDYIGLDCYDGTWSEGGIDSYREKVDLIYHTLHKPVILMEFGFASVGGDEGIDRQEMEAHLRTLGFLGLADALSHPDQMLTALPSVYSEILRNAVPGDWEQCLISFFPHLLKKWPCAAEIPHTEEGQALFYRQILPMLQSHPAVGGAVIYCWQDSEKCFLCGQCDCPCETSWGLIRMDGTPKPAYEAVGHAFITGESV